MIVVCDAKSRSKFIIADNFDRYICSIPIKIKQGPHAHTHTPENQQKHILRIKIATPEFQFRKN